MDGFLIIPGCAAPQGHRIRFAMMFRMMATQRGADNASGIPHVIKMKRPSPTCHAREREAAGRDGGRALRLVLDSPG
jgi:hypothetical protein